MNDKIIKHIKSNTEYKITGVIKVKFLGKWVTMVAYENSLFENFARCEHDFEGFVEVDDKFSDALKSHLEAQGCLQIDTSKRLSLGAKSLLDEAERLTKEKLLVEIAGICNIKTFQEVNK